MASRRARKKAKKMAEKGKSAEQIQRRTGVGSSTAQRYVERRAPASAPTPRPTSASSSSSRPTSASSSSSRRSPARRIRDARGVRQALRIAGPNVSKKELKKIRKATGKSTAQILNRMSKVGSNLTSGAANMLIKQQEKSPFGFGREKLGDSKIAKTLQSMIGTPNLVSAKMRQNGLGPVSTPRFDPGGKPGKIRMIGGTVIQPGGKIAVKKPGAAPAAPAAPAPPAPPAPPTAPEEPQDTGFDYDGILDELMGMMPEIPDYSSMFDDLLGQIGDIAYQPLPPVPELEDLPDPLELASIGKAYGADMMRARQRQRRSRSDYLRNRMNNMALGGIGQALAPMMIGGGLTL